MDLFRLEYLCYAVMFGAGLALLRHGNLVGESLRNGSLAESPPRLSWTRTPLVFQTLGTALVVYASLLLLSNHKGFIRELLLGGSPAPDGKGIGAIAPLIGLVGILMALVTAGVINLARKAVDDVRDARKEFVVESKKHREELLPGYSSLELLQRRTLLLHLCRLEVEALRPRDEEEVVEAERARALWLRELLWRTHLVPSPKRFMVAVARYYKPEQDGLLLEEEKDYIDAIARHWEVYGEDNEDKARLAKLARRVRGKLHQTH